MKTMGLRIQQKREECGLTQEDLGKKLGVSRQTICKWESGNVKHFDRSYIDKMSKIFNCDPAWLMNMDGSKTYLTYTAPNREPITLSVSGKPIIGESAKRAALYAAALNVLPQNLDVAIELLKSLSDKAGDRNA